LLKSKQFHFWKDPVLKERVVFSFHQQSFGNSKQGRECAWLLALGIDLNEKDCPIRDFFKLKVQQTK